MKALLPAVIVVCLRHLAVRRRRAIMSARVGARLDACLADLAERHKAENNL